MKHKRLWESIISLTDRVQALEARLNGLGDKKCNCLSEKTNAQLIKPKVLLNISWELLDPKWSYVAMNSNGEVLAFVEKPIPEPVIGQWLSTSEISHLTRPDDLWGDTSFDRSNWMDTLQKRPE